MRRWGGALYSTRMPHRSQDVFALGLDETLMWRRGRFRTKAWSTGIVDVASGQLLDIVRARTAKAPTRWLLRRPHSWLEQIRGAVLDLSGPYRAAFNAALPDAKQVADPFHVVRLANDAPHEVSPPGPRTHDPGTSLATNTTRCTGLRKLLVSASENITDNGHTSNGRGLLDAGDPYGEVRDAWHAKDDPAKHLRHRRRQPGSAATVNQLAQDLQDPAMPPEINRLAPHHLELGDNQISNWHTARVTNAPTEAVNNLVKRVKRAAFGFTNFANYRIRALLYARQMPTGPCSTPSLRPECEEPGKRTPNRDDLEYPRQASGLREYQAGMKDIRRFVGYFLREEHHDALRYRRSNYPNGPSDDLKALFEQD